jgi:hypothetical protein
VQSLHLPRHVVVAVEIKAGVRVVEEKLADLKRKK